MTGKTTAIVWSVAAVADADAVLQDLRFAARTGETGHLGHLAMLGRLAMSTQATTEIVSRGVV